MKPLIKHYLGLVLLIACFYLCGGDSSNFMIASEIGRNVSNYLEEHHPKTKVLNIEIKGGLFTISLEDGFVVVCDEKGNCRQDTLVKRNH